MGLTLFLASLEVLRREIGAVSWSAISANLPGTRTPALAAAVALTAANYAVMTAYDFIAFAYVGRTLARWRIAMVSALAYAIANNLGFAMVTGASVRYRFYSRWGVTADELSRIMFSYAVTFWLGFLALAGLGLALGPLSMSGVPILARLGARAGWCLVGVSAAYIAGTALRREPLRLGRVSLRLPSTRLAFAQLGASLLDWTLAGAVLFVLLPSRQAPFSVVLVAFIAAQLVGLASHVPGGIGVFDGLIVVFLKPFFTPAELLPALVVYRAVYYLLPLSLALAALLADEVWLRRLHVARVAAFLHRASEELTPRMLSAFAFISGTVLLFSGATPAAAGRLALLNRVLPLGVIETSHIVGSLAGAALLLLSQGLARRLDSAYYLTSVILGAGIASSLLKGGDYEEALLLAVLLASLHYARARFTRRAALFETRFSPAWIAAVVAVLTTSVWLGLFAFRHVEYSHDLWWQFALDSEAPRFLRASVAAASLILLVAVRRVISPAPSETPAPTDDELRTAWTIIETQRSTSPFLVFLRDKALMFDEGRTAFLMYAVQGRTWIALGDPVGPEESAPGLIRSFLERCDDFGGTPVFYKVRKEYLHYYAEFGLTFIKLGEEARVDLSRFTLEGTEGAKFRQVARRLSKDGALVRIVAQEDVPAILDGLRAVSDDWLMEKATGEKRFSLGFFDPGYLARFPVAVVERQNRIVAFANLWPGPSREELSIDLMRYHRAAPKNVMEALFVQLMQWGKEQGYRWFALGMAPMSGFEESPVAPLWGRLGAFFYRHGRAVYNFQGLRAFKNKFNPEWEPYYLAYPGGIRLVRTMADVAALIAGGYRRAILRPSAAAIPPAPR